MLSGADSQWAETIRMAFGLGIDLAQPCSSRIQRASSNSGGAPWLMYNEGSGPSSGVHNCCGAADSAAAARFRCSANGWAAGTRTSSTRARPSSFGPEATRVRTPSPTTTCPVVSPNVAVDVAPSVVKEILRPRCATSCLAYRSGASVATSARDVSWVLVIGRPPGLPRAAGRGYGTSARYLNSHAYCSHKMHETSSISAAALSVAGGLAVWTRAADARILAGAPGRHLLDRAGPGCTR